MGSLEPAPGLEGVAGSLVEVSLHGDAVSCISVEIHDGVIIRHVLKTLEHGQEFDSLIHLLGCLSLVDCFNSFFLSCVHFYLFLYGSVSLLHVPLLPGGI